MSEPHRSYYNPFGADSPKAHEHWLNYLNQATLMRYHSEAVGAFLERTSKDRIVALEKATQQIDGTLLRGFTEVANQIVVMTKQQDRTNTLLESANRQLGQLRSLAAETNQLLGGVNQRLEFLSLQQEANNIVLSNIAVLSRVPDSQKQRQHHIETGMKLFMNASKDADLYQDALNELLAAEKLLTTDYFVLRQIGLLYLYALPLIDLRKASDYLTKAGKYSSIESCADSARIEYVLAKSIARKFDEQRGISGIDLTGFAVEAFRHAAVAQYAMGCYEDALKSNDKALTLDSENETVKFFQAKYLAALGHSDGALAALKKLKLDDSVVAAVFGDFDLVSDTALKWDWQSQLTNQDDARQKRARLVVLLSEKRTSEAEARALELKLAASRQQEIKLARKEANEAKSAVNIAALLKQADAVVDLESKKRFWQSKDYSIAKEIYYKAAGLGSLEAKWKLKNLS